jgi:hypothetical protein
VQHRRGNRRSGDYFCGDAGAIDLADALEKADR